MATNIDLWTHQKEAIKSIQSIEGKCLVKMFCGTGKTRIIYYLIVDSTYNLCVIVFPSIALITQFNIDYIHSEEWGKLTTKYKYLSICSLNELDNEQNVRNIEYTTNKENIISFINKDDRKIITVTYQSLSNFICCLKQTDITIDLLIYDEAHHIIGSENQKLVFGDNISLKTVFFTATPKNDNGITMLGDDSDCGKLAYDYTHYQAVQDGVCNDFNISIDFYADNKIKYKSIYQSIARSVFNSGNNRVLTFHCRSETAHDVRSNVASFVNKANKSLFREEFQNVLNDEFHELKNKYSVDKFKIRGMTCKTKNRANILKKFENTPDDSVFVLASCMTIGEGVDTKRANQICFVDPRTSYTTIIQNIGRCCRLPHADIDKATILIPCYVDANKYSECKTAEEKDNAIREDMNETGNFNPILNVLSALRMDDPEIYDLCLNYPNKYSPNEIKENLRKQGYAVETYKGNIYEVIQHMIGVKSCEAGFIDECKDIAEMGKSIDKCIEIHSNSMEEPIKRYNENGTDTIRLYQDDCNNDAVYQPITTKKNSSKIITPCKRKKFKINVHTDPDVTVLWDITDRYDFTKKICKAYIDCTVKINPFEETYEKLKLWINENNKIPSTMSKNDEEKRLSGWVTKKKEYYNKKKLSEGNIKSLEALPGWFWNVFDEHYEILRLWIEENDKLPSSSASNKKEKQLGDWMSSKRESYKNGTLSRERIDLLKKLYNWYWNRYDSQFDESYNKLKLWVEKNKRIPSTIGKTDEEKMLGKWATNRRTDYKKKDKLDDRKIKLLEALPHWYWTKQKKSILVAKKPSNLTPQSRNSAKRTLPELSELHKKYKTMNSSTLHKLFQENHKLWEEYHEVSEKNESGFKEQDEVPYRRIIRYLTKFKSNRVKYIADLGCGKGRIYEHFANSDKYKYKYKFYNYDHISCCKQVISCDIKQTPLQDNEIDIAILCLSMWGSNKNEYIKEVYRILEQNGILLIIEATNTWMDDSNKLKKLLEENNFQVKKIHNQDKFMFIEAIK